MNISFGDFNAKVGKEHSRQYARNGAENYQRIKAEFQKADYSIESLPRFLQEERVPCLILGSGPSLDDALPYIKEFQGIIFASPSQLDILEKWEIVPDFVVAVDSADNVGEEQIRPDRDCHGMTLLTHPYISPKTLDVWSGRKRYFELKDVDGTAHFKDIYPWIRQDFPVAGSVNNTEVIIANWMGCNPIILAGVDYCFPGGRMRAQDYRKRGPFIFQPLPLEMVDTVPGKTSASQETLFYANLLLGIWKMYNLPLVQLGNQGACTEIPWIPPEDLNKPMTVTPPTAEQIRMIDEAMTSYGMFADVSPDGIGHFHWAEEELKAKESAREAYNHASKQAHAWKQTAEGWKR